jgi:hypothetical protein
MITQQEARELALGLPVHREVMYLIENVDIELRKGLVEGTIHPDQPFRMLSIKLQGFPHTWKALMDSSAVIDGIEYRMMNSNIRQIVQDRIRVSGYVFAEMSIRCIPDDPEYKSVFEFNGTLQTAHM